jgi:hypothetical protein
MMTEKIFNQLKEHKPIVVNYGKSYFTDEDIKESAYYDEEIQKYRSQTGIWGNKLLREIARGEVNGVTIEISD